MSVGHRLLAVVTAVTVLSVSLPVLAADVGIVATRPGDPFVARLGLELEQLGFSVAREDELVARSREVVLIRVSDRDVELFEVGSGGALRRREMTASKSDALKAAEEVRALLLPLVQKPMEPASPAPRDEPPPAPLPASAPPGPAPPTVEAALGAGALFGGTTPGGVVALAIGLFPRALATGAAGVGFGLDATLPVIAEDVARSDGSTSVRAFMAGPELIGRLAIAPRLTTDLALGVRADHVRFVGSARAPFTARSDSAWSWSPAGRLRLQYAPGRLGAFIEGRLGVSMPAIAVRHSGVTTHEWGVPWLTAGAGIVLGF